MDFALPKELVDYLAELDQFIEDKIMPLQRQDDNDRFFDHRREHARTDWDNDGLPRHEWEELLAKARSGGKILIVDDLVDTGATARVVREMLPGAHFATVYAKPKGREMVDTFITEVSQDTWIFFPWDLDVAYVPPISGATD